MSINFAGSIVKKVLYDIAGEEYKDFVTIILSWKHIVGGLLAERAKIQGFQNNTIYVAVNNSVWLQELVLHKRKLIHKIKLQLNIEVKDIIFYVQDF